jgi:hypothetical protein
MVVYVNSTVHCTYLVQCMYYVPVPYRTVQYRTVQSSKVQYRTVQNSTEQYSTVQYSTVQYSTVQYSTVQYSMRWEPMKEGKNDESNQSINQCIRFQEEGECFPSTINPYIEIPLYHND